MGQSLPESQVGLSLWGDAQEWACHPSQSTQVGVISGVKEGGLHMDSFETVGERSGNLEERARVESAEKDQSVAPWT
jgi:hypothetical protein